MFFELRMLTLAIVAGAFVLFIALLRRQKMELRYCLIWLFALLGIAVFCIFPTLLERLSHLFGIETPVNMLFVICIVFLACICISLTVVVSNLSNKMRELTQNIAIIEYKDEEHRDSSLINKKD